MIITPLEALLQAIDVMKSQVALAKALQVRPQTLQVWLRKYKRVPAERVIQIEKATGGLVSRYHLRPDIYPGDD